MRTSNTTLQILSVRGLPPPPPLLTKFSLKKSYGFRGYPPSPLYGHLPNFFSLKEGSKNCVLAENTPIFRSKKVTDLGCTPLPTFTDQNFWRKKELQICEVLPHPPITDKIHKLVFDVLPNMGILLIEQVLALNLC